MARRFKRGRPLKKLSRKMRRPKLIFVKKPNFRR